MSLPGRVVPLAMARRIIAEAIVDAADSMPSRLGAIKLLPHQRAAAARAAALIARNGGVLLAEPVGLGKTFIALAVAAHTGRQILITAPATLRDMWRVAVARCGLAASGVTIVTHEALSARGTRSAERGTRADVTGHAVCHAIRDPRPAPFIIVDEAHRVRTASTKRYAALAEMCRQSPVLLITATPIQNSRADLAAQLALFVGRAAWELSEGELAAYVVRGPPEQARDLPRLSGPHRVTLTTDDDCLDELLALPPAVPARDEMLVTALTTFGLIHQWSSSRAALVAALQRRRVRSIALRKAIEAGRSPTRGELTAWTHLGDAVQLAFPELVAVEAAPIDIDGARLIAALDRHALALDTLLRRLRAATDPDLERGDVLRRFRGKHPGARIIAFCHYSETVNSLWAKLAREPGVAALTAHGARVAGGRVSRETILAQFTPRSGGAPLSLAERIDLLITTDLLSEGLNLQEASVVVHLDLPWNPARLDQRVGRVLRLGSPHETVSVYVVTPPASAERLLRIEERLREKLAAARRTVGVAGQILPSPVGVRLEGWHGKGGLAERTGKVHADLARWLEMPIDGPIAGTGLAVAAVQSPISGFLALVLDNESARLVANIGHGVVNTGESIEVAVAIAGDCPEVAPAGERMSQALEQLERWLATQRGAAAIDFTAATAARSRRSALARVAQALARAPRHRRSLLAPLADAARAAVVAPLGEGAERILETLVGAELPDEAWLRSIAAFGELNARPMAVRAVEERSRVRAVILFQGD